MTSKGLFMYWSAKGLKFILVPENGYKLSGLLTFVVNANFLSSQIDTRLGGYQKSLP